MIITPLQTDIVHPGSITLTDLIDGALTQLAEGSVLAITSKIVSLCEGRVVPMGGQSKEELLRREAAWYLPGSISKYGHHFSITQHTLVGMAGIDESNGDGHYVPWPADPQGSANMIRRHLRERFGLERIGVVITDSTSQPMRLGTIGIALAHSGFAALNDYRGQQDLFGHPFALTRANIAGGLAAAAVVAMGEGIERTPLCLLQDLPFVRFRHDDPTKAELDALHVSLEDDLFAPFLGSADWQRGDAPS